MLYKVTLTFEAVNEMRKFVHSNYGTAFSGTFTFITVMLFTILQNEICGAFYTTLTLGSSWDEEF